MFLEKSSVFKQFLHRKIPVRLPDRDRPDIYFDKVEFTLSFDQALPRLNCQTKFRSLYPQGWNNFVPLYSSSISDKKGRKPHFYDSRLFI